MIRAPFFGVGTQQKKGRGCHWATKGLFCVAVWFSFGALPQAHIAWLLSLSSKMQA